MMSMDGLAEHRRLAAVGVHRGAFGRGRDGRHRSEKRRCEEADGQMRSQVAHT